MAKLCSIEKNEKRKRMSKKFSVKRAKLKALVMDRDLPAEERFAAQLKMQQLPRNSNPNRVRNRCKLTGRCRSYYRKFGMSRLKLREYASFGLIPGVTKSSW